VSTGPGISRTFEIGDASYYTPLSVTFTNVSTAGTLLAYSSYSDHSNILTSGFDQFQTVNRTWSLINSGIVFNNAGNTAAVTLNWNINDEDGGLNYSTLEVAKFDAPSTWTFVPVSSQSGTSITTTSGITSFSDFQVGELIPTPTLGTYPNTSLIAGTNTTITPDEAPTNTFSSVAYTNTNFTGLSIVDPTTGVVTVTDAKQAGSYTITVEAFNGTATATTTFILTVTNTECSQSMFASAANVSVGTNPTSVALGDFNGDGKQDLVVVDFSDYTVSIRLGDGSGEFSGSTIVSVGTNPYSVAVGDFNGDGTQDIAVVNSVSNTVTIRLGDGSGDFGGSTEVSVGNQPASVVVGDFNNDGKLDIATGNYNSSGTVSIRLGDGTGEFSGSTEVSVGTYSLPVAIGDFNNDGKEDLAVGNLVSATVSIRLGDGTGEFSGTTEVSVGAAPASIAVGDFNSDGKQDIAVANQNGNTISIRLGDGSGDFSGSTELSAGSGPESIAVGDFNGDGNQDIATANYGDDNVSIRLGDGTGGFTEGTNVSVGDLPYSVAVGDFNSDGREDLAVANQSDNTVSIRLGGEAEINVQGNSIDIVDGDATPTTSDHTDFGNVCNGSNLVRTYTIQNTGTSDLTVSDIQTTGTDASFFLVGALSPASLVTSGNSSSFTVTFSATSAGLKSAVVHITSNDCDEADYDFAIKATALDAVISGTVASGDEAFCNSGDPSNITLSVSPSGGAGTFNYQWYYQDGLITCPTGTNTSGWTIISGETNSSYDPPSGLTTSRTYAVQTDVTGPPDCEVATWASSCRKVSLYSSPSGGTFSVSPASGCSLTLFHLTASGWTDTNLPLMYQFFYEGGALTPPQTSSTADVNILEGDWHVYCLITNSVNCSTTSSAQAVTVSNATSGTWLGTVSSDWNDANNWCGGVPTSTTNVIIHPGGNMPEINASAFCHTLTIDIGATLTINGTNNLTVTGDLNDYGTFIPNQSTVTLAGVFIQNLANTTFYNLTINNPAGVVLHSTKTITATLTLQQGAVTTGVYTMIITSTGSVVRIDGWVNGNLQLYVPTGSNVVESFDIGDETHYLPVTITFASVTAAGNLTGQTNTGDHPQIASSNLNENKSVQSYWTFEKDGSLEFTTYDATFNWPEGYIDPEANPLNFIVGKHD